MTPSQTVPNFPPLPVIGLVGGVAAGKSQVARMFAQLGAAVIDADRLGHAVLEHPEVARELQALFGSQIVDPQGRIQRPLLGQLVFGPDPQAAARLQQLQAVVHPLIHAAAVQQLEEYRRQQPPPRAVVVDAPLLLEAGWAPLCNAIVYVASPLEIRRQRAAERGWNAEELEAREASQMSLDAKRQAATHCVSGTLDDSALQHALNQLLQELSISGASRGQGL